MAAPCPHCCAGTQAGATPLAHVPKAGGAGGEVTRVPEWGGPVCVGGPGCHPLPPAEPGRTRCTHGAGPGRQGVAVGRRGPPRALPAAGGHWPGLGGAAGGAAGAARGAEPGDPAPAGESGAAGGEWVGAGAGAGNAGGEPDAAAAARRGDSRSPGGPVCQPERDPHGSVGDDGGRLAGPRWHPGCAAPAAAGALGAQRLGVHRLPPRLAAARAQLLPVWHWGRGVGEGPGALPGAGGPAGRHRGPPGAGLPGRILPPPRLLDRAPRPRHRGLLPVGGREPQHLPELALGAAGRGGGGRGLRGHGPPGGLGGPALCHQPRGVGLRAALGLLTPPRDPPSRDTPQEPPLGDSL